MQNRREHTLSLVFQGSHDPPPKIRDGQRVLSLTPHLGALPLHIEDAPGKTLPTVNSNDPLKDVKWDDPVPSAEQDF